MKFDINSYSNADTNASNKVPRNYQNKYDSYGSITFDMTHKQDREYYATPF